MASRGPFSESRTFFRPPEASTMASGDGKKPPRQPKSAPSSPRWPHDCPRSPQEAPRALRDDFQEGPKKPKSLIFIVFFSVFRVLAFSGCRHSKTAQEASNIAPRGPQEAPRALREDLQEGPKRPKPLFFNVFSVFFAFPRFRASDTPRLPKKPPTSLQEGPRGPQQASKTAQEGAKTAQEALNTA